MVGGSTFGTPPSQSNTYGLGPRVQVRDRTVAVVFTTPGHVDITVTRAVVRIDSGVAAGALRQAPLYLC